MIIETESTQIVKDVNRLDYIIDMYDDQLKKCPEEICSSGRAAIYEVDDQKGLGIPNKQIRLCGHKGIACQYEISVYKVAAVRYLHQLEIDCVRLHVYNSYYNVLCDLRGMGGVYEV